MTIFIRKQVNINEEGVNIFWHVQVHEHDLEDNCNIQDYFSPNWIEAMRLQDYLLASLGAEKHFLQMSPIEWVTMISSEAEHKVLAWQCYPCTEAFGEPKYTDRPAFHLEWHRKRFGVIPDERLASYEQKIASLEQQVDDLRRGRSRRAIWND